ncbi:MAG: lipocalin family protein [Treponema sp.]|nr:lipocalin family protein [Treponema sp.]
MKKIFLVLIMMFIGFGLFAQATDVQIREAANTLGVPYEALRNFVTSFRSVDGTWVSDRYTENWITFSGRNFTYGSYQFGNGRTWLDRRQHEATNGTYTISDGRIAMTFSDGRTEVYSFSRSENIITIQNNQLIRRRN